MKKFIKYLLYFIPCAILGHIILICVFGETAPRYIKSNMHYRIGYGGHMYSRINDLKKSDSIDILFIGTSHSYRGFDPRIFAAHGYKVFNLGSSMQTPLQTRALLKRHLDRLHPKLIVYDVNPAIFESDGVESSLDIISNDRVDWETVKMAFIINHIKTYNTMIFGAYRQLFKLDNDYNEKREKNGDIYIEGGFVERQLTKFTKGAHLKPSEYKFKDKQVKAFDDVISIYKQKSIPYILVRTPVVKDFYYSKSNNAMVSQFMKQRGRFYDFNEKLKLADSVYFYDNNHLNKKGVKVFNEYFIRFLEQEKLLD